MSYKINKTDGVLLVDLVDGRIDTATTDLVLIGRNFTGYGELFNENFIKLLENFAAVSPPSRPLLGQLWYDTSDGRLKIWNGEQFRSTDTTVVGSIEPQLLAGDIWIDSRRQQLYFNDGTGTTLAGPIFTREQGPTGFKVDTINDRFGNPKTVAKIIVNSAELALISKESFEAALNQPGFGKNIQEGININVNRPEFEFRGIATTARQLIDSTGDTFETESVLKVNANNVTTGSFFVNNNTGLRVGRDVSYITRTELNPKTVVNEILDSNADYRFNVNRNGVATDAIYIDTPNRKIGLWTNDPSTTLDVDGDVRIAGNLTVEGDTTVLEVETLKIQNKLLELATTADSTIGDNIAVDGAGIMVLSSDGSKDWIWKNSTNSWTSNVNIDIASNQTYQINGQTILSQDTLAPTVLNSSLTSVGKLVELDVDDINLNGVTITTTGVGLNIVSDGVITVNNQKIAGVTNPTDPQDVSTKSYVDVKLSNEPVFLDIDVTGVSSGQINNYIKTILDTMLPWETVENPPSGSTVANPFRKSIGTKAIIHVVSRTATVVTNPTSQTSKSFVAVDSGGVQNQSVVQDFSFSDTTNNIEFAIGLNEYRTFEFQASAQGGEWQFLFSGVQYIP